MDKSFLVQLTNNLYHLTLLFPKKEPLRYKMRELADEILANSFLSNSSKKTENCSLQILEELEILDCFFEVAKTQNWVQPEALFEIQREYSKIKDDLQKRENQRSVGPEVIILPPENLKGMPSVSFGAGKLEEIRNSRQQKILEILKEKGRAQVWEMKKIFPEVSKRTLRRDFEHLLKQGLIERIGEKNETFYRLKE